jgi:ribosomal protein L11 methyltransferase
MDFIEITFPTATAGDLLCELLPYWLENLGFQGFYESESGLRAYIASDSYEKTKLSEALNQVHKEEIPFTENLIPDKNWNEEWEHNYSPVIVDDLCLIRAPFHPADRSCRYEIVLEPKMSFGTGHHETTSLMISEMLKISFSGLSVLDAGSGTGILAILAEMLGADTISAVDNDAWCIRNARENMAINRCTRIRLIEGDVTVPGRGRYDCILANINLGVLMNSLKHFNKQLNRNGLLLVSGILTDQVDAMRSAGEESGFDFISSRTRNMWALVRLQKK